MKKNLKTLSLSSFLTLLIIPSLLFTGNLQAQVTDKVLVIVNDDVITQSEFDFRLASVNAEFAQTGQTLPENVGEQLLESMIDDRIQIQEADRRGLEVSEEEVDQAIARFAEQQGQTVEQFEQSLGNVGQAVSRFRKTVRESLIISRLTEFYATNRVYVPDYEVEGAMSQSNLGDNTFEYQVAHILIPNLEGNKEQAELLRGQLLEGLNFEESANKYSQAPDAKETNGVIGWRKADQLPEIYANAVKGIEVGGISEVLESENALHIVKLLDRKGQVIEVLQSNVRHILLEADSEIAIKQASKKLLKIKARLESGEDFAELARIYSEDSVSAADGGSLEWVNPGQMVAPFEQAFEELGINEISEPVVTQFGVHLIQVLERRNQNVTDIVMKNRVRTALRRQRANREFSKWVRQLKEQAYINHVAEPTEPSA